MIYSLPANTKYETTNPFSRYLIEGFLKQIDRLVKQVKPSKVLDVGCGEGILTHQIDIALHHEASIVGIDIELNRLSFARKIAPIMGYIAADIYKLPLQNVNYDLVVCTEVLEHLKHPEIAMAELSRVTAKYLIVSVPREPLWRMANVARAKYFRSLGNTPAHINHWSRGHFIDFVGSFAQVVDVRSPFPWTIVLARR